MRFMAEQYFNKNEDPRPWLKVPIENSDHKSFDVKKNWKGKEITLITHNDEMITENFIATYWG